MKSVFIVAFLLFIGVDREQSTAPDEHSGETPGDETSTDTSTSNHDSNFNTSTIEPLTSEEASDVPRPPPTVTSIKKEGSLKCYRCWSTKSFDECDSIQQEIDCPDDTHRCYKFHFKGEKEHVQAQTYVKGCTASDKCKQVDEELCKIEEFGPGIKCEITWCSDDLCNAAALPMVSAIILTVCACLAFLY